MLRPRIRKSFDETAEADRNPAASMELLIDRAPPWASVRPRAIARPIRPPSGSRCLSTERLDMACGVRAGFPRFVVDRQQILVDDHAAEMRAAAY